MAVELSQVRAFVAVSRRGTIAAAAEDLHVTPSPLSRTIRELERQLGGDLFSRSYHQFTRTELGDRLLPLAVELVAQADEFLAVSRGESAPLRFGATPWTSRVLAQRLSEAVADASPSAPDPASELSAVLLESLRHGDLDLALVHLPIAEPGIATLALAQYGYALASIADPTLDLGRPLRLSDLAGRRLLTLPLAMQPTSMGKMFEAFKRAGIGTVEEIDLRDIIGVQTRLVRTGEVMLVTRSTELPASRFFDFDQLEVYPFADGELDTTVGLAWRERDSVHAKQLDSIVAQLRPPDGDLPYFR